MADDKRGREAQARHADRRQREREILTALERADEIEPPADESTLSELTPALTDVSFPASGRTIVGAVGDQTIDTDHGRSTVAQLLPETDAETFDSASTVRIRLRRPTVAASMKRILEAHDAVADEPLRSTQREAYEKTLRALTAVDADDDDEGIEVVTDWIVDQLREAETAPGSRQVRKRAVRFCRSNGYEIRNDQWLGV